MLREGDIPRDAHIEGSVEGECLFARAAGSNLRILADNIWDYSRDDIPEAWRLIGEDPRDDVRAPQFAQLVRAFMPGRARFAGVSASTSTSRFYR